jgi:hypothetical protein
MKNILFFATKEDLLPVIDQVESKGRVTYICTGNFPSRASERYNRGADIPGLGQATSDSAINSATYLVIQGDGEIRFRPFKLTSGVEQFAIDQLVNPDSVTFTPGGLWIQEAMLYGRVATVSDSDPAQELMRRFHTALKKRFAKMKAYYVGPQANALRESGMRLTIATQSPREYDLKP